MCIYIYISTTRELPSKKVVVVGASESNKLQYLLRRFKNNPWLARDGC